MGMATTPGQEGRKNARIFPLLDKEGVRGWLRMVIKTKSPLTPLCQRGELAPAFLWVIGP